MSRADLSEQAVSHLAALVADWSILADLGFSDLVLYLPTWNSGGFVAAAQVRPATVPTRIPLDVVATFVPKGRLPQVDRALAAGEVVRHRAEPAGTVPLDREAIPVRPPGAPPASGPIAVIARYGGVRVRPLGALEDAYLRAADDLADMVAVGKFPVAAGLGSAHRVGDGLLRVDRAGTVVFASPNAQSAMRAVGLTTPLVGAQIARVLGRILGRPGSADQAMTRVASGVEAGVLEVESGTGSVAMRAIPLDSGGALLLVRDVTELRQTERALLTKDATIREVHHRVKNNLQTVAALLRLQARRLPAGPARGALLDAVARVSTIAHVHETLSHEAGQDVDFDAVAGKLAAMARDAAATHNPDRPPAVVVTGSGGTLSSGVATPLAMVLSELLLNAAEHAGAQRIELVLDRQGPAVHATVRDDGSGFDPLAPGGLGLQIVGTLVAEQLHGVLRWHEGATGTAVTVEAHEP
jgi:two-component sensor histidine kinase